MRDYGLAPHQQVETLVARVNCMLDGYVDNENMMEFLKSIGHTANQLILTSELPVKTIYHNSKLSKPKRA